MLSLGLSHGKHFSFESNSKHGAYSVPLIVDITETPYYY